MRFPAKVTYLVNSTGVVHVGFTILTFDNGGALDAVISTYEFMLLRDRLNHFSDLEMLGGSFIFKKVKAHKH